MHGLQQKRSSVVPYLGSSTMVVATAWKA